MEQNALQDILEIVTFLKDNAVSREEAVTKEELHQVKQELRSEMVGMKDELRSEMVGMKDELRSEMVGMKDELLDPYRRLRQTSYDPRGRTACFARQVRTFGRP